MECHIANKAAVAGGSIYTTSILPCSGAGGTGKQELSEVFHWKGWEYHQVDDFIIKGGVEVSTAADHILLTTNGIESMASVPGKKLSSFTQTIYIRALLQYQLHLCADLYGPVTQSHMEFKFRIIENFFYLIYLHSKLNSLDVFQIDYVDIFLPSYFPK